MSREVWERVLQEVSPTVHTMQFFFQGEPLLHPDLARMISDARAQNIYTIVSTNAQALTREMAEELMSVGLNRIIVSMDGLTQKSYGTYRIGGRLNQTLYALQWLRAAKQKTKARCIIELQCLKLRSNEHEWKELRSRYRAMGADRLVLKTAQLYNYEHGHPLMPSDPRHSRYEQDASGVYRLRRLHTKGCLRVWSGVVISTTGEVLPCCYDKSCAHSYGNITEQPLQQLFHNEKAQRFMRQALTYQPAICHNCWQ